MLAPRIRYYGLKCLSIIGLFFVTFALPHVIPGSPLSLYESRFGAADQRERLTTLYGFDRPLAVQYAIWMQRLATGRWGISRHYHRPVFDDILRATGLTLMHLFWTAVAYAIWTAALKLLERIRKPPRAASPPHRNIGWLAVIPNFLIALLLYDIAVWELGWADLISVALFDATYYRKPLLMFIPASVIAFTPLIVWHTSVRNRWSCGHRGRGQRYRGQWRRFCFYFRPLLAGFVMELLLTEYVFTLPGLGSIGVNAIRRHDFPMLQGFLLATGGLYMVLVMLLDWPHDAGPASARRLPPQPIRSALRQMRRPLWGLIVLLALAVWAPYLAPQDATEIHTNDQLRLPNARYLLGTDFLGRDVLSRTLHGFRSSIPRVLLISAGIAALSGLLAALSRRLPPTLQRLCRATPLLFAAFPPFLLALMVVLVVERQLRPWSCEVTLFIAGIPVGFALFRDRLSMLRAMTNLAAIGEVVLLLDVAFFYLRLSPEPVMPTWGGDIRIGAQYSHINIWALLSPIIAVVCSRIILHQFSHYDVATAPPSLPRATTSSRHEADDGTTTTDR